MTSAPLSTCPQCGHASAGRFCSNCGSPLAGATCRGCGATLSVAARFCHACGAPTGATAASSVRPAGRTAGSRVGTDRAPWYIAGAAVLVLVVTVVVVVVRSGSGSGGGPGDASVAPGAATTDLSQMTPREAADRLFDRVARLSEAGDTAQVSLFAPMALDAYRRLDTLDADARFHIGLIMLAAGQPAGALAQADTIQRAARTHLFAFLLRAQAAQAAGDAVGERRALEAFLTNYRAERAKNLPEYAQHTQLLIQTREQAERGAGGAAPTP